MTTYVVGDIQGCLNPLICLIKKIGFDPAKDQLWSVGDIVNRGPDSLDTLRFLKNLGESFQMVLGNHDLHLIAVACGVRPPKKGDTLGDVLKAPDCQELIDWLRQQPLIFQKENHILVHAGIPHIWTIPRAIELAKEVQSALSSPDPREFLRDMYENDPDCWSDQLSGTTRLRVITNYLTRMRCCDKDGRLDLLFKGPANESPQGVLPWFDHYPAAGTKKNNIYFGHWAALKPQNYHERFHALDSGCIWGRELTLYNIEQMQRITCDC